MDSATDASPTESTTPEPQNIAERLRVLSADNPELTEYALSGEAEAGELLICLAATLKQMAQDVDNQEDRAVVLGYERTYRHHVQSGSALEYIRGLNEDDQLYLWGLKIVVPVIVLQ